MKTRITIAAILFVLVAGLAGCTDEGKIPTKAPVFIGGLTVGFDSVYTFPQDTVILTVSGGIPPYTVAPPTSGAAQCSMADSTLTVTALAIGSGFARITDAASPTHFLDLPIVVKTKVSFTSDIQPIFVGSYGCTGCHGGTMNLFLESATTSYQNLVNVPAQSSAFLGLKRVNPRNLGNSLLYIRLSSSDPTISMPRFRNVPFDSTLLANVKTWILQGARNN